MEIDIAKLKQELDNDPEGLGYTSNTMACVKLLNDPVRSKADSIPAVKLLRWLAINDRYKKLATASASIAHADFSVSNVVLILAKCGERVPHELLGSISTATFTEQERREAENLNPKTVSRAVELGLVQEGQMVRERWVKQAKASP